MVLEHTLKALTFFHSLDVIHSDVKPGNTLLNLDPDVDFDTDDDESVQLHLKVVDFGSCLVADPARCSHITQSTLRHDMRHVTTMAFRAPEIVGLGHHDVFFVRFGFHQC